MTELMEQVQREDRAWLAARLHERAHGNWLGPDECAICLSDLYSNPFVILTGTAQDRIGVLDFRAIVERARSLNARVTAYYSTARYAWDCTATTPERTVNLVGDGPLVAVLAGVLDDLEAA